MSAQDRAWESAYALLNYPDSLTPDQHILCLTTVMRAPEHAALEVIALAAMILGSRT